MDANNLHRRKASKDGDENMVLVTRPMEDYDEPLDIPLVSAPPPPRNRVHSTPNHSHSRSVSSAGIPTSAGPFRQSFASGRPSNGNSLHPASASPYRTSVLPPISTEATHSGGHSRTRSVSAFSPTVSSPLASSFPPKNPTLYPFPPPMGVTQSAPDLPPASQAQRHRRLHSRNLSVFFPRPGSLPHTTIDEDGGQDIEVPVDIEAPVSDIPSAQPAIDFPTSRNGGPPTPLKAGFTFGGRSAGLPTPEPMSARSSSSSTSRRGHHHKHSMSHNFFSFLEPGATMKPQNEELTTQPAPIPVSPWAPMSAFPQSAKPTKESFDQVGVVPTNGHSHIHDDEEPAQSPPGALAVGLLQFVLGAWLWVCGQQIGSLSVTGLGYWVVFDAFGVVLSAYVPHWLELNAAGPGDKRKMRRPYGNAPVETVFMFAHAVYLMFSSVYVCKETVEHILLTAGGEEGHHHHHGDEDESVVGIAFPVFMTAITLISLCVTSLVYNNHSKLVNVTGNRLPRFSTFMRSLLSRSTLQDPPPTTPLARMLSNPFSTSPLLFCIALLCISLFAPDTQHRTCDLLLAAFITVITFNVAYRACAILGTVLLQTSPARGSASGKMEAFLRAMREVERHPQVLHLPAPHIWQLSPSPSLYLPGSAVKGHPGASESLVVTLELHVKHDLGDDDVLNLTRWAWEKCAGALGGSRSHTRYGINAEVTVGVVRG